MGDDETGPDHRIDLYGVDGQWHFRIDMHKQHSGCGTKPTIEEAVACALQVISYNKEFAEKGAE